MTFILPNVRLKTEPAAVAAGFLDRTSEERVVIRAYYCEAVTSACISAVWAGSGLSPFTSPGVQALGYVLLVVEFLPQPHIFGKPLIPVVFTGFMDLTWPSQKRKLAVPV